MVADMEEEMTIAVRLSNTGEYTYFAEDGSYGNAMGLVVIETSNWSDKHWENVEIAWDPLRPTAAMYQALRAGSILAEAVMVAVSDKEDDNAQLGG